MIVTGEVSAPGKDENIGVGIGDGCIQSADCAEISLCGPAFGPDDSERTVTESLNIELGIFVYKVSN